MLVLSRKIGETFFIGKDIEVMVVDVDRNKVKIGITAPKETLVLRSELLKEDRQDESEGES